MCDGEGRKVFTQSRGDMIRTSVVTIIVALFLQVMPAEATPWLASVFDDNEDARDTSLTKINVSNASQLNKALRQAKSGDSILLSPGDYGSISISSLKFSGAVTITSASSSNMAHLDGLVVAGSTNLVFRNLDIGRTRTVADTGAKLFITRIIDSSKVTLDGLHIHGSMDNNPSNDLSGLRVSNGSNIKIINSEFEQLARGGFFEKTNGLNISANKLHDIRMDGMNFAQVHNVLIDSNYFTDFVRGDRDHPDAIQFWTSRTTASSTDIVIRNNQILQGKGAAIQGIFITDQIGNLPYKNLTIENNLIFQDGMPNGIMISNAQLLKLTGNTVISAPSTSVSTWIRLSNITGGTVSDNVTDRFVERGKNVGVRFATNTTLASPGKIIKSLKDIENIAGALPFRLITKGAGYQLRGIGSAIKLGVPISGGPVPDPRNVRGASATETTASFTAPTLADALVAPTNAKLVDTKLNSRLFIDVVKSSNTSMSVSAKSIAADLIFSVTATNHKIT